MNTPAEVISVYQAMQAILANAQEISRFTPMVVFLFGVFATWFYLRHTVKVSNRRQLLISVGAFCVWTYSTSSTVQPAWYNGTYAALLLVAYTSHQHAFCRIPARPDPLLIYR